MWALQGFVGSRDLDRVGRSRVFAVHNRDDEAGYGGEYILLSHPSPLLLELSNQRVKSNIS